MTQKETTAHVHYAAREEVDGNIMLTVVSALTITNIKYMKTKGIETRNGFYSPNRLSLYKGCDISNLKYSKELSKNIICLPFFTSLKEKEMEYIAKTLLNLKR